METVESETRDGATPKVRGWIRAVPFAATGLLVLVLLGVGVTSAHSVPPNASTNGNADFVLANVTEVTGLAAAPNGLIFATSGANCSEVWLVGPGGTVSLYAEVPVPVASCGEGALVVAPPLENQQGNGWGSGGNGGNGGYGGNGFGFVLYYAVESHLFAITDNGNTVTTVATFPLAPSLDLSVTYDQVGSFDHDLIVVGQGGSVWLVNGAGDVSLLVDLKTHSEGPAVAPWGFGSYGGDVLVAEQKPGTVVAVSPTGTVSTVTSMKKAEDVLFPTGPYNPCGQAPNGVLLVANYANGTIEAFPASELELPSNVGIVDGEFNAGIAAFTATGSSTNIAGGSPDLEQMAWAPFLCQHSQGCGGGNCGHGCGGGNCGNGQGGNPCHGGQGRNCNHGPCGGQGQ